MPGGAFLQRLARGRGARYGHDKQFLPRHASRVGSDRGYGHLILIGNGASLTKSAECPILAGDGNENRASAGVGGCVKIPCREADRIGDDGNPLGGAR